MWKSDFVDMQLEPQNMQQHCGSNAMVHGKVSHMRTQAVAQAKAIAIPNVKGFILLSHWRGGKWVEGGCFWCFSCGVDDVVGLQYNRIKCNHE
ncbi:unnamed protein product [Ceratitis capitata]|uniref:(Mediterranean fruit fly) hypothetical protein n=1 Tax=Ceratitis capitata TaxID=7213 RepID=A0A811UHU1_CERCA|nr:unnamed protein product [Ceratitis capitata]